MVKSGINYSGFVVIVVGLIMIVVFVSFIFVEDIIIKFMGLVLVFGIFVDVFIVCMIFVLVIMIFFGKSVWYIFVWFDCLLFNIDVEGELVMRENYKVFSSFNKIIIGKKFFDEKYG